MISGSWDLVVFHFIDVSWLMSGIISHQKPQFVDVWCFFWALDIPLIDVSGSLVPSIDGL